MAARGSPGHYPLPLSPVFAADSAAQGAPGTGNSSPTFYNATYSYVPTQESTQSSPRHTILRSSNPPTPHYSHDYHYHYADEEGNKAAPHMYNPQPNSTTASRHFDPSYQHQNPPSEQQYGNDAQYQPLTPSHQNYNNTNTNSRLNGHHNQQHHHFSIATLNSSGGGDGALNHPQAAGIVAGAGLGSTSTVAATAHHGHFLPINSSPLPSLSPPQQRQEEYNPPQQYVPIHHHHLHANNNTRHHHDVVHRGEREGEVEKSAERFISMTHRLYPNTNNSGNDGYDDEQRRQQHQQFLHHMDTPYGYGNNDDDGRQTMNAVAYDEKIHSKDNMVGVSAIHHTPTTNTVVPLTQQQHQQDEKALHRYENLVATLTQQVVSQQEQIAELRSLIMSMSGVVNSTATPATATDSRLLTDDSSANNDEYRPRGYTYPTPLPQEREVRVKVKVGSGKRGESHTNNNNDNMSNTNDGGRRRGTEGHMGNAAHWEKKRDTDNNNTERVDDSLRGKDEDEDEVDTVEEEEESATRYRSISREEEEALFARLRDNSRHSHFLHQSKRRTSGSVGVGLLPKSQGQGGGGRGRGENRHTTAVQDSSSSSSLYTIKGQRPSSSAAWLCLANNEEEAHWHELVEGLVKSALEKHITRMDESIARGVADRIRRVTREHVINSVEREFKRMRRKSLYDDTHPFSILKKENEAIGCDSSATKTKKKKKRHQRQSIRREENISTAGLKSSLSWDRERTVSGRRANNSSGSSSSPGEDSSSLSSRSKERFRDQKEEDEEDDDDEAITSPIPHRREGMTTALHQSSLYWGSPPRSPAVALKETTVEQNTMKKRAINSSHTNNNTNNTSRNSNTNNNHNNTTNGSHTDETSHYHHHHPLDQSKKVLSDIQRLKALLTKVGTHTTSPRAEGEQQQEKEKTISNYANTSDLKDNSSRYLDNNSSGSLHNSQNRNFNRYNNNNNNSIATSVDQLQGGVGRIRRRRRKEEERGDGDDQERYPPSSVEGPEEQPYSPLGPSHNHMYHHGSLSHQRNKNNHDGSVSQSAVVVSSSKNHRSRQIVNSQRSQQSKESEEEEDGDAKGGAHHKLRTIYIPARDNRHCHHRDDSFMTGTSKQVDTLRVGGGDDKKSNSSGRALVEEQNVRKGGMATTTTPPLPPHALLEGNEGTISGSAAIAAMTPPKDDDLLLYQQYPYSHRFGYSQKRYEAGHDVGRDAELNDAIRRRRMLLHMQQHDQQRREQLKAPQHHQSRQHYEEEQNSSFASGVPPLHTRERGGVNVSITKSVPEGARQTMSTRRGGGRRSDNSFSIEGHSVYEGGGGYSVEGVTGMGSSRVTGSSPTGLGMEWSNVTE